MNYIPPKVALWLDAKGLMLELVLVAIVLLSAALNYTGTAGGGELVMISMSTLAVYYFLTGYIPTTDGRLLAVIAMKVFAIGSSVCTIALLFTVLKLTGAQEMLVIGSTSMAGAMLVLFVTSIGNWNSKLTALTVRGFILGGIAATTLLKLSEIAAG